jgi:hypothetical protein
MFYEYLTLLTSRRQRTKCEASETFCGRRATRMMRRGGVSGGIFKGGRRGGETQYVLPRPPLKAFRGVGEPLCEQRSLTTPAESGGSL